MLSCFSSFVSRAHLIWILPPIKMELHFFKTNRTFCNQAHWFIPNIIHCDPAFWALHGFSVRCNRSSKASTYSTAMSATLSDAGLTLCRSTNIPVKIPCMARPANSSRFILFRWFHDSVMPMNHFRSFGIFDHLTYSIFARSS